MDHDEFDFSDPDLDDLPASTLLQLERSAIHATQQPRRDPAAAYVFEHVHDNGNANSVSHGDTHRDTQGHGDEIINLDDSRMQQYSRLSTGGLMDVDEAPPQSQADAGKLLQRIKKLELEKWRLNNSLQTAQSEANKKAGEAENVRRRADTERRAAEQRLQALQQEHREATEKLRLDRDNAQRQLDEHDAQQAEQMRRMRRPMAARPKPAMATAPTASPSATPKKAQKSMQLGDGFDDEDIIASPSKRRDRPKAATPKQTHKRKRLALNDSPIQALQLSEPREPTKPPELGSFTESKLDLAMLRNLWKDEGRFNILQRLLAHRCSNGQDRILEALAQHSFPSQPDKKLSSIVYDSLSGLRFPSRAHDLALRVCRVFTELWGQCFREKHYTPIFLIVDALQFVLACEPALVAMEITEDIVPLVVASIDLVAPPVLEAASRIEARVAALYSPAQRNIADNIDLESCLELLYLVATSCVSSSSEEPLTRFWRAMPHKYVLLLLHRNQPLAQMSLMLRILATSAMPNSLGPMGIHARDEAQDQAAVEAAVISRLTNLLGEAIEPIPDPKLPSLEPIAEGLIWKLRLQVLDVLTQFSMTAHGCAKLASDHYCIGRLVKYLDHCVASLYARPLSPTQRDKVASINASMKLVHYLSSNGATPIKNKLKGVEHAYHVVLTRITFSDRLVLEEGIESQVIDMAHEILDENVGPEEGEQLLEVFPSANSA